MQSSDGTLELRALLNKFKAETPLKDAEVVEMLEIMMLLLTNILNNPFEAKFRTIKKTNAKLRSKLFVSPLVDEIFKLLGFVYQDEALVLLQDAFPAEIVNALPILKEFAEDVRIEALPPEEKAKRLELRRRQRELEEKFRKEKEEAEKLKNLAKLDRKEKAQEEKPKDSQGKTLVFGAQTKCFKDIGVDLNNQRRG